MRAMQIHTLGSPMEMVDIPRPSPAAGEVLVRVHTCGINLAIL